MNTSSKTDKPNDDQSMIGPVNPAMSDGLPRAQMQLIVVAAFDRDEEGNLAPTYGLDQQHSEERAIRLAKKLRENHVGVIAWSREANPAIGEYGEPTILFQPGDVLDME